MAEPQTARELSSDRRDDSTRQAEVTTHRKLFGRQAGPPWYRRRLVLAGLAIVIIAVAIAGARSWTYARSHESTDDAFIEGEIIRISPQVAGHVASVLVDDNWDVKAGQLLLQIDDRQVRAALEQARAQMRAAEADARRAHADALRAGALVA